MTGGAPAALAERPELFEDLRPVAEAFGILAAGRAILPGFGETVLAPIPLTEIASYLAMFGHAGADDAEAFTRLIRAADQAYLTSHAERRSGGGAEARKTPPAAKS